MTKAAKKIPAEHDFALVIDGVDDLSETVMDALFEAGCDDATFTIRHGRLYGEFSRSARSLKDAILSAIKDVRQANVGAVVLRVDNCELVTQAEIARRIGRSRQMILQYINGNRGPGGFPAPECHLAEGAPLWAWCAVSSWLAKNDIIRPEAKWDATVVAAINATLDVHRQHAEHPELLEEIERCVAAGAK
jgi:transcriptional regulator with XRE-family HTH domain